MLFTSRYANYRIGVDTRGGHKTVAFSLGILNSQDAAKMIGTTEKLAIQALKAAPSYGVDFYSAEVET